MVARHKLGPSGSENEVNRLALQYIGDERTFDQDYRGMKSRYTREGGATVQWPRVGQAYQADLRNGRQGDEMRTTTCMLDPGRATGKPRHRCTTNDDCTRPSLSIVARREGASRVVRTVDEGPCVFYSADRLRFRDRRGLGCCRPSASKGVETPRGKGGSRRRVGRRRTRDHVSVRNDDSAPQPRVLKRWENGVRWGAAVDQTGADADGRVVKCKKKKNQVNHVRHQKIIAL